MVLLARSVTQTAHDASTATTAAAAASTSSETRPVRGGTNSRRPIMDTIFIVEGQHFHVPGIPISAHATIESANKKAADLVNLLLESAKQPKDAKADTWEADLLRARNAYALDMGCDLDELENEGEVGEVWITELPIQRD